MATFTLHHEASVYSPVAAVPTTDPASHLSTRLSLAGEVLAGFDWLALRVSNVYAGVGIPRGDGSAVVLLPGMLASNSSLNELRRWLRRIGYRPRCAELERNDGCPENTLDCVIDAVDRAHTETGRRIHLIGHSLGGLLARGAAMARPGKVGRVVTLGSPVNGVRVHPAVALGGALFMRNDCDGTCFAELQRPLPANIEEISVYSKTDGIVEWETCRGASCESIEVRSSHIGLVANAEAYRAIATTLAKPLRRPSVSERKAPLTRETVPVWMRRAA
jgi:pimeloyl-ACP methyl ester carboxylesterase